MKKKVISFVLTLVMSLSLCVPAFASDELMVQSDLETVDRTMLQASESAVISSTADDEYEYISIVDFQNGTVQAVLKNISTGEYIYGRIIELNPTSDEETGNCPQRASRPRPTYHQDTFSNIEYDIWVKTKTEWCLERPDDEIRQHRFYTLETARNASALANFRNSVDSLNDYEFVLIGDIGSAVLNTITAMSALYASAQTFGTLTPAAVTEITNAIKAGYDVIVSLNTFADIYNCAARAYFRAYDLSKVYDVE